MDVSPIQHSAVTANAAMRAAMPAENVVAVAPAAQGRAPAADQEATRSSVAASMQVLVSWHPGSLGYVTRVVDQASGSVLFQSPPEQVLAMVEKIVRQLEGDAA